MTSISWLLAVFLLAAPNARAADAAQTTSADAAADAGAADALERLRTDPSAGASSRLAELYRSTQNTDQRFWIIHALGARLKEQRDVEALKTLLDAARESDPALRGPVLRALTGFAALPKQNVGASVLARLGEAAARGGKDKNSAVRSGAADLERVLRIWRDPSSRKTPAPPPYVAESSALAVAVRALRWLWVLILPVILLLWLAMGLAVFDAEEEGGRRARTAWKGLARQRLFLAGTGFLWLCLAGMLAGYGFDLLVWMIGRPLYTITLSWGRFYFAAGLCLFLPGALLAAGLARSPERSVAVSSLRFMPWALLLWGVAFGLLWPLEVFYRLFIRRTPDGEPAATRAAEGFDTVVWIMETGAFRSGYLAAAVIAGEGHGLLPALGRARELFKSEGRRERLGLTAFDTRFALLCAAPVLAFFCALVAKGQPVEWGVSLPVVLLGCSLWSWTVLAGVLWAVVETLEGIEAARAYHRALSPSPAKEEEKS